jgi:CRP-like cAMP-binding protein
VLHKDPSAQAALAAFGAFTAGAVVLKGDGLAEDFCLYAKVAPGKDPVLRLCDDEDELEELGPDYLAHAPHKLVRDVLRAVLAGETPDGLALVTSGRVKLLKGDLGRVVKVAGQAQHRDAGLAAIRSLSTKTLG